MTSRINKSGVVVQLSGGLGNQMFQYAAAKVLAWTNNVPLALDLSFYEDQAKYFVARNFELAIFDVSDEIVPKEEVRKIIQPSLLSKIFAPRYKIYTEPSHRFDARLKQITPPCYLTGYFQSEKYLEGYHQQVRELFEFKKTVAEQNKAIRADIENTNAISVHIRRTDFVDNKAANNVHGVCTLNYYKAAIELMASKIAHPTFYIFSDDPNWVRQAFGIFRYPMVFIGHNQKEDSWQDMYLMSFCKHNIVANSSFSWWGAWLNRNNEKITIAPKDWVADKSIDCSDVVPSSWIRIEN